MPPPTVVRVRCGETVFGEHVRLAGSSEVLGRWDPARALPFRTAAGTFPIWEPERLAEIRPDDEFKLLIINAATGQVRWENTPNRRLHSSEAVVELVFGKPEWHGRRRAPGKETAEVGFELHDELPALALPLVEDSGGVSFGITSPFLENIPKAASFLDKLLLVAEQTDRVRRLVEAGSVEREVENITELMSACAVYLALIRSGAVKCVEEGGHHRPNHHAAAALRIFSTLVELVKKTGPGPVVLGEGNTQAAEMDAAEELQRSFTHTRIVLAVRRIIPCLPSFDEKFTCAVPLTRIRDIAHRNDIPQELKSEIKHTLQNKLHRSAGPEDLVAALALQRRLHAEAWRYGGNFLSEFDIFVRELQEFFNAAGLIDRLRQLERRLSPPNPEFAEKVTRFAEAVSRQESGNVRDLLAALEAALALRTALGQCAGGAAPATAQLAWSSDVGAEGVAFAILARINAVAVENVPRGSLPLSPGHPALAPLLAAARLSLCHLRLSGVRAPESAALGAWIACAENATTEDAGDDFPLVVRAIFERVAVLVRDVCGDTLAAFACARRVGAASGLGDSHAPAVFAEGEVRGSLAFQLSRLATGVLRQAAAAAGGGGVEVLVAPDPAARVAGRLLVAADFWDATERLAGRFCGRSVEKTVLALTAVSGDEETAELRQRHRVEAILALHPVPYLSHLGIRARQDCMPFVAVDASDAPIRAEIAANNGRWVELRFDDEEGCKILPAAEPAGEPAAEPAGRPGAPREVTQAGDADSVTETPGIELPPQTDSSSLAPSRPSGDSGPKPAASAPEERLVAAAGGAGGDQVPSLAPSSPMAVLGGASRAQEISDERCGRKAAACARLSLLAESSGKENVANLFRAPTCWVLPFGTMEQCLRRHGLHAEYVERLQKIASVLTGSENSTFSCEKKNTEFRGEGNGEIHGKNDDDAASAPTRAPSPASLEEPLTELHAVLRKLSSSLTEEDFAPLVSALQEYTARDGSAAGGGQNFIVRSSASVEDVGCTMSAAGLYESIAGVSPARDAREFIAAVAAVWASLHTQRAVVSRALAGIEQSEAHMAVLVQDLVGAEADLCFVMHTRSPVAVTARRVPETALQRHGSTRSRADWALVELALGLGEVLTNVGCSRGSGTPFRALVNKVTGQVCMQRMASLPYKYVAGPATGPSAAPASAASGVGSQGAARAAESVGGEGGSADLAGSVAAAGAAAAAAPEAAGLAGSSGASAAAAAAVAASAAAAGAAPLPTSTSFVCTTVADYSRDPFGACASLRLSTLRRLGRVAAALEAHFGGPQDAEGVVVFSKTQPAAAQPAAAQPAAAQPALAQPLPAQPPASPPPSLAEIFVVQTRPQPGG